MGERGEAKILTQRKTARMLVSRFLADPRFGVRLNPTNYILVT